MKKIVILSFLVLALISNYQLALATNSYFHHVEVSALPTSEEVGYYYFDSVFIISSQDLAELLEIVDQNGVMITASISDDDLNLLSMYLYGNSAYVNHEISATISRTKTNDFNLSDPLFELTPFSDSGYGKLYRLAGLPSYDSDLITQYRSFTRILEDPLYSSSQLLNFVLRGSTDDMRSFVNELQQAFPNHQGSLDIVEPSRDQSEDFSWLKVLNGRLVPVFLFLTLSSIFVLIIHYLRQRRNILIYRFQGISTSAVTFKFFVPMLLGMLLAFILGTLIFDLTLVGSPAFYNQIFYINQAILIFSVFCLIAIIYLLAIIVVHWSIKAQHIKQRTPASVVVDAGMVLKFLMIILFIGSTLSSFSLMNYVLQDYFHYYTYYDTYAKMSYISSLNAPELTDFIKRSKELEHLFQAHPVYCAEFRHTSYEPPGVYPNSLELGLLIINDDYAQKFLPQALYDQMALNEDNRDAYLITSKSLFKDHLEEVLVFSKRYASALRSSNIEIIPTNLSLFLPQSWYHVRFNPSNFSIVWVRKPSTVPKSFMNSCFMIETTAGSTDDFQSVIHQLENPNGISIQSQKYLLDLRLKILNTRTIDAMLIVLISWANVLIVSLILIVMTIVVNAKRIIIQKSLGISNGRIFRTFLLQQLSVLVFSSLYFYFQGTWSSLMFWIILIIAMIETIFIGFAIQPLSKDFKRLTT